MNEENKKNGNVLSYNNTNVSNEPCGICGKEAGRVIGDGNVPVEGMANSPQICPECGQEYPSEFVKARDLYHKDFETIDEAKNDGNWADMEEKMNMLTSEVGKQMFYIGHKISHNSLLPSPYGWDKIKSFLDKAVGELDLIKIKINAINELDKAIDIEKNKEQRIKYQEKKKMVEAAAKYLFDNDFKFDSITIDGTEIVCEQGKLSIVDPLPF
jgi:hypothetical protein